MKIGITGSRNGVSDAALDRFKRLMNANNVDEIHHGDCKGTDEIIHNLYCEKVKMVIHPPKNSSLRAYCQSDDIKECYDYLERNNNIVEQVDVLVAFPDSYEEKLRSGTWYTIRRAKNFGMQCIIIFKDGSYQNIKIA